MGLIFLIVAGGALGWLSAIIVNAQDAREIQINLASGISGSLLAGLVISPLAGGGNLMSGPYSVEALGIAMLGTVAVLTGINLWRQRELG